MSGQPIAGTAAAGPAPDPGDDESTVSPDRADAPAGLVGRLANQVAEVEAALLALQSEVALKREETNKAFLDLQNAQATAATAQAAANQAREAADAAHAQIIQAQRQTDRFAAASYRQGSTVGSVSAFLGSDSPEDLLARAELLNAVGGSQLDALENLRRARAAAANKDAHARAALAAAYSAKQVAAAAKTTADFAYQAAVNAAATQAERSAVLQARKSGLDRQFDEAQRAVPGLGGQRQDYQDWIAVGDREHAAAAAAAGSRAVDAGAHDPVQAVIGRILTQLGVRYSWGGGDANGPTVGMRDGGAGDAHGDYRQAGFDCSGLMIYAFAALGYSLPHYSGAQYRFGRQVPLAAMRPGDMLFWGSSGRINHVALYLGNGQMIEAPYSGSAVRVTPVRYSGIMPYVTRLL
ncbi:MAG: NlpC/P60 family protein [Pseudonocardiaceae bacterium]